MQSIRSFFLMLVFAGFSTATVVSASPYGPRSFGDEVKPFTAVVAAYEPEIVALLAAVEAHPEAEITETVRFRGVEYFLGRFRDEPIVIYLSGVSVPNAAMTTQMVIDYFPVRRLLFSGVAGGVNPALAKGDVSVAGRWAYHNESAYFNASEAEEGGYVVADYFRENSWFYAENRPAGTAAPNFENFGMIFPDAVGVRTEAKPEVTWMAFFEVDAELLALAESVRGRTSELRNSEEEPITYLVGGTDVTGSVFVDNAEYREWLHRVWEANVTEMESAAVGHVCYVNEVPWLIVRGVSDLAGGQEGKNEENVYDQLASENAAAVVFFLLEALTE